MSKELNSFRETAMVAISDMAQVLPAGCELLVVAYRPGSSDFDLVLPSPDSKLTDAVDVLRRRGLSIDGNNAYKRDLCDSIVGAIASGYQNSNPPPDHHWAMRFWNIGRGEGMAREELTAALKLSREELRACQAVIHLRGGFDPAYVNDAQAAMKVADDVLTKYPPLNPA
jgi:hypothetical protein